VRHFWVQDDGGGDEYSCANCGRTVRIPDSWDGVVDEMLRSKGISSNCDEEKVRHVMES
jgi:DNA-directed RNA polymerase subunit RPC12/RpoP